MKLTVSVLSVVLIVLLAVPAIAQRENSVAIEVTSIRASAATGERGASGKAVEIDPKLEGLGEKLSSLFAYGRYSMIGRVSAQAPFERLSTLQLPERFLLEVEPVRSRKEGDRRIDMTITLVRDVRTGEHKRAARSDDQIVLRTRLRLESGGTILLGGPPIKDGTLILALSARN